MSHRRHQEQKSISKLKIINYIFDFAILGLIASIILHDYIIKPYIHYDYEIWENGEYKKLRFSDEFMQSIPNPSEISGYNESLFYYCYMEYDAFFRSLLMEWENSFSYNSFALELTFDEVNYQKAEEKLYEKYVFLTTPIHDFFKNDEEYDGNEWIMPYYELTLGEYTIKIIHESHNVDTDINFWLSYPGKIPFIAYNGKDKIRYCYLFEPSTDYISAEVLSTSITKNIALEW